MLRRYKQRERAAPNDNKLITLSLPYGFVNCVGVWLRYKRPAQREKEASI